MRLTFFLAFIPSCIAVILLVLFVKDTKLPTTKRRSFVKLDWSKLDTKLRLFLIISFIFAVGNSSDAFILLQAKQLGFSTTLTVLAYVLYNTFQTVFATPAGQIADRVGAKRVFNGGLFIFALVYLGFGLMNNANWLWILFPVYGIYIAMTDGVSKAFISDFITPQESGTYFGFYYTLTAVGTFLASFLGGLLWTYISPSATFFYGSSMAFIAFLLFLMTGNAFKQTGKIEAKVV